MENKEKRSIQSYADQMMWLFRNRVLPIFTTLMFFRGLKKHIKDSWLGLTLMLGAYRRWAVSEKHLADVNEMRAATRKLGTPPDLKAVERYNDAVRRNRNLSAVLLGLVGIGLLVFYFVYRDNIATEVWGYQLSVFTLGISAFIFGIILICDAVGHNYTPPKGEDYTPRPVSPLEPGISTRKLQTDIVEILRDEVKPPIFITFHGVTRLEHGVEFEVHLTDKLTDEHLRTLERHLQAGKNMVSLVHNRKNTAAPVLRVFWTDPLGDSVAPAPREPKSLSCQDPFYMTRDELGHRAPLSMLAHQLWTGGSGSGKSSALWTALDWLVDCKDADVYGVDIGGTVFGPYRRRMQRVADTVEDAVEILQEALDEAERRVQILKNRMDVEDDEDDDEDEVDDENWVIKDAPGHRAIFIILDEFAKIAEHDAVRELVDQIYETGRKAAVYIIVSTPGADKERAKTNSPIHHSMIKILFSTPITMITTLLGKGAIEAGWRPDVLRPGSKTDPADAGKCYINAPEFPMPVLQRFDRLTPLEIKRRNRLRRPETNVALPEALGVLLAVFEAHGKPEKLPTSTILAHDAAQGWNANSLAKALKDDSEEGKRYIPPAPGPFNLDGKTARGYSWEGVSAAVKACRRS